MFTSRARRWLMLLGLVVVITTFWLTVLPWLGAQPQLRNRIQREQGQGINPGAMFYSELDAMPEILRRLERRQAP